MTRLVPLIVLLLLLPAASVLAGDLPQVLQPNTTAYSASEVAALTQAMATLTEALNDYDMASQRYFSPSDWSSRDFAMYTTGVLSGEGYETLLVSGDGWPDGVHTWVLVGIPLGSKTAWIPVEAAPKPGNSQQNLGHIPSTTDATGRLWYEESYLNFSDTIELQPNLTPVAHIRMSGSTVIAGESTKLLALASIDPDGEIILYQWNFGDGQTKTFTSWVARHTFKGAGNYTLQLSVIDNRGKTSVTTSMSLRVSKTVEEEGAASSSSGGGCGCGG